MLGLHGIVSRENLLWKWSPAWVRGCYVRQFPYIDARLLSEPNVLIGAVALLARDYRHRRGGMPDLFLWSVHARQDGSTFRASCFLEVKSPNDRLADKQEVRTCLPRGIEPYIGTPRRSGWTSSCGWEDGRRCAGSVLPQGASYEDQSTALFSLVGCWRHMSLQSGVCACPVQPLRKLSRAPVCLCVSLCASVFCGCRRDQGTRYSTRVEAQRANNGFRSASLGSRPHQRAVLASLLSTRGYVRAFELVPCLN